MATILSKNRFEELYALHSKQVYNLALNYVQNSEDAQEITQDVFVTIYQQHHKFREESNLSTWVYRITINKCLDFIRSKKQKRRFAYFTPLSAIMEPSHFNHPGVLMEYEEETKRIFAWINELPEQQKTALILQKLESKSMAEVAEIMQLTTKAVESLIQRAKANLTKKIDQSEGF